jgi:hypothetical protein
MGLDMYLSARKYVSGYSFSDEKEKTTYKKLLSCFGITKSDKLQTHTPSGYIEVTVAYWRKANAIHKWFVDVVQNGVDECQRASVSREQLQTLVNVCQEILDKKELQPTLARTLLPAQSGFFFGSTDYDEWYYRDLEETIHQIKPLLSNPKFKDCDFQYQSSW